MSKTLCMIPARGGSKRVPGKNYRMLAGRPLIAYVIEAAKLSERFDEIVVSSDHDQILEIASGMGVSVDRRRTDLAEDRVPAFQVAVEYLSRVKEAAFDNIAFMLPTCPFSTWEDVQQAFRLFEDAGGEVTVIGVTEFEHPPQFGFTIEDGHRLEMREPETFTRTTRSQSVGTVYHANGAIWISRVDKFLDHGTFYASPMQGCVMSLDRSFDIDEESQFELADIMMRKFLAAKRNERQVSH